VNILGVKTLPTIKGGIVTRMTVILASDVISDINIETSDAFANAICETDSNDPITRGRKLCLKES